jgi:hypothetical protein
MFARIKGNDEFNLPPVATEIASNTYARIFNQYLAR